MKRPAIETTLWLGVLMALAGCAGTNLRQDVSQDQQAFEGREQQLDLSQTEGTLEKTGFVAVPANTPERQRQMLLLPPYKVVVHSRADGTLRYLYADAAVCDCIYVGNEAAYDRYRGVMQAQNIADDISAATGMPSEAAVLDWGSWETASQ